MATTQSRILVVDDDNLVRDMLVSRINNKEHYEAIPASNGLEALDYIHNESPDLILLDIIMPRMNGYEVLEKLRQQSNQVPVVVMSALDDLDDVIRCINLGADDYLRKPIKPEFLWSRLEASIEKKQLRDREKARIEELKLLQKIDLDLNQTLDTKAVTDLMLGYAIEKTAAHVGMVGAVNEGHLEIVAAKGLAEERPLPFTLPLKNAAKARQIPLSPSKALASATNNRIVIPVRRNHSLHLCLVLDTDSARPQPTVDFLVRLSNHAAIALHNAQLYQEAKIATREKTNFIGIVSHELKNPLQAILSYVDLIKRHSESNLDERQLDFLDIINTSAKKIQELAGELDDITRIETGNIKLRPAAFAFAAALKHVLGVLQPQLEQKKHELQLALAPDLPQLWADRQRVEQILLNLISNAIKYTPEAGRVEIGAHVQTHEDQECLAIYVKDNGIGMSLNEQSLVFSQFFRANNAHVRSENGTGLGLHITKKLVSLHGGEIDFQSSKEKGTTFYFTLPLAVQN